MTMETEGLRLQKVNSPVANGGGGIGVIRMSPAKRRYGESRKG